MKEKETKQLLDEIEPEIVRNLDPIYQRLLEILREARSRQDGHKGSGKS